MLGHRVNCAGVPASSGRGPGSHPTGDSRGSDLLHSSQPGELLTLSSNFPLLLLSSCSAPDTHSSLRAIVPLGVVPRRAGC